MRSIYLSVYPSLVVYCIFLLGGVAAWLIKCWVSTASFYVSCMSVLLMLSDKDSIGLVAVQWRVVSIRGMSGRSMILNVCRWFHTNWLTVGGGNMPRVPGVCQQRRARRTTSKYGSLDVKSDGFKFRSASVLWRRKSTQLVYQASGIHTMHSVIKNECCLSFFLLRTP